MDSISCWWGGDSSARIQGMDTHIRAIIEPGTGTKFLVRFSMNKVLPSFYMFVKWKLYVHREAQQQHANKISKNNIVPITKSNDANSSALLGLITFIVC